MAVSGVVDLAAHVSLSVGVGVRGGVGCWCGRGERCSSKGEGGAGECGGATCLYGDLPGMVGVLDDVCQVSLKMVVGGGSGKRR